MHSFPFCLVPTQEFPIRRMPPLEKSKSDVVVVVVVAVVVVALENVYPEVPKFGRIWVD